MIKLIVILILSLSFQTRVISISAESVILMDQGSGRILYAKNIDNQKLIASITKIMTAVLAIESKKLDEVVKIDEKILKAYGSNIYIEINEEIRLKDLIYGLMLRSGNDAAIAIANFVSNDEEAFVQLMNKKANKLGMKNTVFCNPHGLDEKCDNLSTARDMAILTKYANSINIYKQISGTKRYVTKSNLKTYDWYNKNKLLSTYKYTTGGKTGYTERARRTLVTTASKNNLDLIVVTLNDPNDFKNHQQLYEYGFNNYYNYLVLNKETFNLDNDFYSHPLYINYSYYYPLKKEETETISLKIKLYKNYHPKDNEQVGVIEVYKKRNKIHEEPIYIKIKREHSRKSFFRRLLRLFR